ncbi:hypothetical protein BGW36DRAFT_70500 [Talaromyces proteolyticus]|uniref:Zn(2)-C6 fungal-type domain-containing protein n=1 Tax=Talaromyces proteolyticus TaxID=1131652 RepID=A0AAD4PSN7_9EURO|nr:uncharacterized protein BGW36DRAFT_70500 [Talaromyces proteolyticus]KAH8689383.1 hypothetical protein BGW36DRAFT_70500 [Talaromyces proteolyticus]
MTEVSPVPPREEAPSRIKLRSACDRCSLNKIKCSQDKPECQRCKTIGVQCHYSRSMRMGKPRKSAKAKAMASANANNNNTNNNEASRKVDDVPLWQQADIHHPWSTADWNFDSVLAGHEASSSAGDFLQPLFDSPAEIAPTAYSQQSDDSFLGISPQSQSQSQSPASSGHNATIIKDDPENVYLSPSSYYAASFDAALLPPATTPPEGLSPSMLIPQSKPHDCTQLALETLVSLSLPSTVQKTSQGQPRPTMDQVLRANCEAIKNTSTMLSCGCPKDSSFPMLIATIFSKALAWYQAAVGFNDDGLFDSASAGNAAVFNHAVEEVVHRPISVGGYELDDESCDLMKFQLVLSRLRMMSKPIKQYLDMYAPSGSYPSPSSDAKPAVSTVSSMQVFLTMGIFVQSRLQHTIDELQSKVSQ